MPGFTYDFVSNPQLSQVRMLIADTDITHPIYDDDEITNALYLESSQGLFVSGQSVPIAVSYAPAVPIVYSVYRSAALLLDALASNKSRLAAINSLLDVKLSPEKAAQELRATAKEYRDVEANNGSFAIAEMVNDQFSARERIWKQLLRLYGNS
jgi:hypothetical protein